MVKIGRGYSSILKVQIEEAGAYTCAVFVMFYENGLIQSDLVQSTQMDAILQHYAKT